MTLRHDFTELDRMANYAAAIASKERPDLFDDMKQEALLVGWRELDKGSPMSHAVAAMKYRALQIRRGDRMTGSDDGPKTHDGHRRSGPIVRTLDDGEEVFVAEPVESPLAFEIADRSDTDAAVRAALVDLEERDRRYLFLRFWRGLTAAEIEAETGVTAASSSVRWSRHLRPALRNHLAALAA